MANVTVHQLIDEIRDTRGFTIAEICDMLGIAERTYYRSKPKSSGEGVVLEGKELTVTPELILTLSQLLGKPCRDVATQLGYGYLYEEERKSQSDIDPYPLVPRLPMNNRAIELAVEGRNAYGYEGDIRIAKVRYSQAVEYAREGGVSLLANYIQLLLGNTLRMLGKVAEAEQELLAVQTSTQVLAQQLATTRNGASHLIQTANLLNSRAMAFLAFLKWSRGDLVRATIEAPTVLQQLEQNRDYAFIPYVYYVLGRVYHQLEQPDQALMYAEKGLQFAYLLAFLPYAKSIYFLDHPIGYGYQWRVDHLLQLKTDVLIGAGDVVGAEEAYLSMRLPKSPATSLSLHNWFSANWQEYKAHRQYLWAGREDTDSNISASFDIWRNDVEQAGNPHVQAIVLQQYAQTLLSGNQTDAAVYQLQQAMRLAKMAGADYTAVTSGIELTKAYAQRHDRGDKELAISTLDMLQGRVERLAIPSLWEKFHQAREVAGIIVK